MTNEENIMNIIVNGGDARSSSLKAIKLARAGNLIDSEKLMRRANESITKAHKTQTQLIQDEIRGEKSEITLLLIHAQDHLMNAITVKEIAIEMIEESKKRIMLEKKIKEMKEND